MTRTENRALIIGAGSGIAGALVEELLADPGFDQLICVSRLPEAGQSRDDRLQWLESDYSEASIDEITRKLQPLRGTFSRVFICNGVLHDDDIQPEKRLEELSADSMHQLFHANAVVPALWLKHLCPLLCGRNSVKVAVFSARVGSIDDNRLGGWYSYRASKAALNMLVRTAAIEYRRRAANVRFVAFHPGTTDTPLSKPFQHNVPTGKLFSPRFVARRLIEVLAGELPDEEALFLDWSGKVLAW